MQFLKGLLKCFEYRIFLKYIIMLYYSDAPLQTNVELCQCCYDLMCAACLFMRVVHADIMQSKLLFSFLVHVPPRLKPSQFRVDTYFQSTCL